MPVDYILQALVTLLVIVDPVALAPIFLTLTAGYDAGGKRRIAYRAVAISFAVLLAFALGGQALIGVLGISFSAFRIAGGILLFAIAFEMLFERRQARKQATASAAGEDDEHDPAAFPLAIPLIAGPGAITAVMLLADATRGDMGRLSILIGVIVTVMALCLAAALLATRMDRLIGQTGRSVFSRLLGILLAALAVQFVLDGAGFAVSP